MTGGLRYNPEEYAAEVITLVTALDLIWRRFKITENRIVDFQQPPVDGLKNEIQYTLKSLEKKLPERINAWNQAVNESYDIYAVDYIENEFHKRMCHGYTAAGIYQLIQEPDIQANKLIQKIDSQFVVELTILEIISNYITYNTKTKVASALETITLEEIDLMSSHFSDSRFFSLDRCWINTSLNYQQLKNHFLRNLNTFKIQEETTPNSIWTGRVLIGNKYVGVGHSIMFKYTNSECFFFDSHIGVDEFKSPDSFFKGLYNHIMTYYKTYSHEPRVQFTILSVDAIRKIKKLNQRESKGSPDFIL